MNWGNVDWHQLLALFGYFATLSLVTVGGPITTAPGMHRFLVDQQHWLTDTQFTVSISIAQAAPGPNVLFVTLLGWNVAGPMGALATTVGIMGPSTVLVLLASHWVHEHRQRRVVRSFKTGLAPLTVGLTLSTGFVLALPYLRGAQGLTVGAVALIAMTILLDQKTKISPVWLVLAGGVIGALGWV
jgi:chromate transporter